MDFNGSGSLTMRYLWGPTGIVARQTSGGTVSWYLADHLGTVRDLINNSGAIIDHVDFSAFGTVLAETSPTSGDRFTGFAMLERDTITGLNLAVYREENPGTGRWDSQDPLGFAAHDTNLNRYVQNSPVNSTDTLGLQSVKDPYNPPFDDPIAYWFWWRWKTGTDFYPQIGRSRPRLRPIVSPVKGPRRSFGPPGSNVFNATLPCPEPKPEEPLPTPPELVNPQPPITPPEGDGPGLTSPVVTLDPRPIQLPVRPTRLPDVWGPILTPEEFFKGWYTPKYRVDPE